MKTTYSPDMLKHLAAWFSATWLAAAAFAASPEPATAREYDFGLSPFYASKADWEMVKERVFAFILRNAPPKSAIVIYDAYNLAEVTRLEIPDLKFVSLEAKVKALRSPLGRLERWLDQSAKAPLPADPLLAGALKMPEFLEFIVAQPKSRPRIVLLLGSPYYVCETDPSMTMKERRFPSDTLLLAESPTCPYGAGDKVGSLTDTVVQQCYLSEGIWRGDKSYRNFVAKVWAKHIAIMGGTFTQFTGDMTTFFGNATNSLPTPVASTTLDFKQPLAMLGLINTSGPPQVIVITPTVRSELTNAPAVAEPRPRLSLKEAFKHVKPEELAIGVAWKHPADLDLWVWASDSATPLCFQDGHQKTPEGWYNFDHQQSTGVGVALDDSEFVVLRPGFTLSSVRAFVNFYKGSANGSQTDGEVIVRYQGTDYHGRFTIPATTGNQGVDVAQRQSSRFWTEIQISQLVKAR